MNPTPNPFGAPGPLPTKSERKAPHHQPSAPSSIENPFSAGLPNPASEPNLDWGALLDDLPFGLIILGPQMELLHENDTCGEWFGVSIAEAGGIERWLTALCPEEEHREKVLHSWRGHIWRNQLTRAFSLKGKNQKVREIEFRSTLQEDGGLTVSLQDVTDNVRAQSLQRQSKLKFRALFRHSSQGVALLDREEKILEANPAFLRIADRNLRELRLTVFEDLLHSSSLPLWRQNDNSEPVSQDLQIETGKGKKPVQVRRILKDNDSDLAPNILVFVEEPDEGPSTNVLSKRLRTVARKAKSLLEAVPDLILLVDKDLKIADFAAPPEPWKEHQPVGSWRGSAIEEVWPVLGKVLHQSRPKILELDKTIHADLEAGDGLAYYSMTASGAGDGQILIVVRNQSELEGLRRTDKRREAMLKNLPEALICFDKRGQIKEANTAAENLLRESSEQLKLSSLMDRTGIDSVLELSNLNQWLFRDGDGVDRLFECEIFEAGQGDQYGAILRQPAPPSPPPVDSGDPFIAEQAEHQFRNQLQLATSLHQFEPVTSESREASLRWQIRLRTLMATRSNPQKGAMSVSKLLHDVAGEIGSLTGRGPGSRCVSIEGPDQLILSSDTVTSLGLFIGEVLRIVLIGSTPSSGPDLSFRFRKDSRGFLQLQFETGTGRHKISESRPWEGEILEILAAQMQGSLTGRPVGENEEWTLRAAVLDETS